MYRDRVPFAIWQAHFRCSCGQRPSDISCNHVGLLFCVFVTVRAQPFSIIFAPGKGIEGVQ